jgi:hypothetical protein
MSSSPSRHNKEHLFLYRKLAAFAGDRERLEDAMRAMPMEDLACVMDYLINLRTTRDARMRKADARCKAEHGCSAAWFYEKKRSLQNLDPSPSCGDPRPDPSD